MTEALLIKTITPYVPVIVGGVLVPWVQQGVQFIKVHLKVPKYLAPELAVLLGVAGSLASTYFTGATTTESGVIGLLAGVGACLYHDLNN